MKQLIRKTLTYLTVLVMMMLFTPVLPGGEVSAVTFIDVQDNNVCESADAPGEGNAFTITTSSDQYVRFDAEEWLKTTRVGVFFTAVSCGGTPRVTQVDENGNEIGSSNDMWAGRTLDPIVVTKADIYDSTEYPYVYFKISGGLNSRFSISSYPYAYNQTKDTAAELADNTEITGFNNMTWRDSNCSYGTLWYKLTAEEKAKYRIHSPVRYYYGIDDENVSLVPDASDTTVTLDKGKTLYIEIIADRKKNITMEISREVFNRMTSMEFDKSPYNIVEGDSTTVTLNYERLDPGRPLESDIVAYDEFSVGDGGVLSYASGCELALKSRDDSKAVFDLKGINPGRYLIMAKNSEGLMPQAIVNVMPKKMNVKGASSEGTHKSSKVHWGTQIGVGKYVVYLKASDGNYIKKGTAGSNDYNIKGLSANKTYYVKIAPVKTGSFNGSAYSIEGAMSDPVKIVTAPSKAPKIKSAKATGTKYHKAVKTWHAGHYDAGYVWHPGYYTTSPAYSSAAVKVNHTKVKGASSYTSNGISFSKGTAGYKLSGKIKAGKKQSVKIRAVKKSGSSIAYGPWSKAKVVKLKAAK